MKKNREETYKQFPTKKQINNHVVIIIVPYDVKRKERENDEEIKYIFLVFKTFQIKQKMKKA